MGLTDLYAGCTRAVRRNSYCKNLCLVCFGKTLATAWPEEQPKRTQSMKGRTKGSHGLSPGASRSTRTCHLHQLCLRALPQLSFPPGCAGWSSVLQFAQAPVVGCGDPASTTVFSFPLHPAGLSALALMKSYQAPESAQNGKQRPCSLHFIPGVLLNT